MRRAVYWQAAAAICGLLAGLHRIVSVDYWSHLAFGRAFLAARTVHIGEPFLWRLQGGEVATTEWPFQILLYLLQRSLSHTGVCVAVALCGAATGWLLSRPLGRWSEVGRRGLGLVYVVALLALAHDRFVPRPEAVVYPIAAALFLLLAAWHRRPARRSVVAMGLLFLLWVPLHVTWTIGLCLVALSVAVEPHVAFWRGQLSTGRGRLFLTVVAATLAAAVPGVWRFVADVATGLAGGGRMGHISEMLPVWNFPEVAYPYAAFVAASLVLAWGGRPGRGRRLLFVAACSLLGVVVVRNVPLAMVAMAPFALEGLDAASWSAVAGRYGGGMAAAAAVVVALLVGWAVGDRELPWGVGVVGQGVPRKAARFVVEHHLEPVVYNDFDTGGYLNWAWGGDPPTFQDGRALGGAAFVQDCDRILRGVDTERALARYGVRTVLTSTLFRSSGRLLPLVGVLLTSPAWRLVAADDALVFVRPPVPPGVRPLPPAAGWRRVALDGEAKAVRGHAPHAAYTAAAAWAMAGEVQRAEAWMARARAVHPELYGAYAPLFGGG